MQSRTHYQLSIPHLHQDYLMGAQVDSTKLLARPNIIYTIHDKFQNIILETEDLDDDPSLKNVWELFLMNDIKQKVSDH